MSNFNDRIEINTSTSVIVLISKTLFGFCNNLNLSVPVFTQPNLALQYLDNHLLTGIYFYNKACTFKTSHILMDTLRHISILRATN